MISKNENPIRNPDKLRPSVRKKLETVALEVFSETDFHRVKIQEIAKKAGVSYASIYKYYGSKEGLLFGCVDTILKALTKRMVDHLQGIENVREKLRKAFWVELDFYERNPHLGQILFLTVPFKKWLQDKTFKQEKLIKCYLDVIREGQEKGIINTKVRPGVCLDFLHSLVQWRTIMWFYRGQEEPLTENFDEIFNMLWRSISNPSYEKDR